ncbi:gp436 family protein [Desulfovulcanus sp.]
MYATIEDLTKLLPESDLIALSDDENTGALNEARLTEAIDQADREIDAYCAGRYEVPFASVPGLIQNLSAQMAIYNLFARRGVENPLWETKYRNCLRLLELIRKGEMIIGEQNLPQNESYRVKRTGSDRMFTSDNLGDF